MTGQSTRERIGRAEATGLVAQLVRGWVEFYTGGVSAPAAERRRDEIHSDLWEQQAFARETGVPPLAVAFSVARRAVIGIPADLLWVHTERAALRSLPAEQKARTAMNSVTRFAAHWWWVLGAAVLSAIVLTMGIQQLLAPGMPYLEGTIQALTVGSLLAAGVILKAKMPRTAAALIAGRGVPELVGLNVLELMDDSTSPQLPAPTTRHDRAFCAGMGCIMRPVWVPGDNLFAHLPRSASGRPSCGPRSRSGASCHQSSRCALRSRLSG